MLRRVVIVVSALYIGAVSSLGSAWATSPTPSPKLESTHTLAPASGVRVEIRKAADGTVEFVEVEDDTSREDTQAAGLSPVLMYAAGFAALNIVLGIGMTGVTFWEEIQ